MTRRDHVTIHQMFAAWPESMSCVARRPSAWTRFAQAPRARTGSSTRPPSRRRWLPPPRARVSRAMPPPDVIANRRTNTGTACALVSTASGREHAGRHERPSGRRRAPAQRHGHLRVEVAQRRAVRGPAGFSQNARAVQRAPPSPSQRRPHMSSSTTIQRLGDQARQLHAGVQRLRVVERRAGSTSYSAAGDSQLAERDRRIVDRRLIRPASAGTRRSGRSPPTPYDARQSRAQRRELQIFQMTTSPVPGSGSGETRRSAPATSAGDKPAVARSVDAPLPVIVAAALVDVELAAHALHAPLRQAVLRSSSRRFAGPLR